MKRVYQSAFSRLSKIAGSGMNILAKETRGRFKSLMGESFDSLRPALRLAQVQELTETLSQLKGAAMKAGQLVSLEFSDWLPQEIVDVLRTLHDSARPMPFEIVKQILEKELSKNVFGSLTEISSSPLAAASISQVHTALFRGQKIALKIQVPGVAGSIDSDLFLLRRLFQALLSFRNTQIDIGPLFEELADGLRQEVDFRIEAINLQSYGRAFSGEAAFVVPRVVPELVTERVLGMSFEDGERLGDVMRRGLSMRARDHLAATMLELLFLEFFKNGLVQTDPNYGNYLYRGGKIVLLDFGATRHYDLGFRQDIARLLKAASEGERGPTLALADHLKVLDPREDDHVKELFLELLDSVVYMFRIENQPFNFANAEYLKTLRERSLTFATSVKYTSPAKTMIFLNRKLGGVYHLLKDLSAQVDTRELFNRVVLEYGNNHHS